MSKISFIDKIKAFYEVSISSRIYVIILLLLIILGIILIKTNRKTAYRNKIIYLTCTVFLLTFLGMNYHASIGNIWDYMMNNFFIAVYFPNLAIYLAAIVATNIIVWISIFNFKTSEPIKILNVGVYVLLHYLLGLILSIITKNNLDVFSQSSIYSNESVRALIELSSTIFFIWIIFLILYKIILIYLRKEYKPKVKKVIIRKKVLPKNYENVEVPEYIMGHKAKKENILNKSFEDSLTLEDYKILLTMLKEKKLKEKKAKRIQEEIRKEQNKITELEALYRNVR